MKDKDKMLAELEVEAREKTDKSRLDARILRHDDWRELVTQKTGYGQEDNFPEEGIFARADEYLRSLKQSIGKGAYAGRRTWSEDLVRLICAFGFKYDYSYCFISNSSDGYCIEESFDSDTENCFRIGKMKVVSALKDYLLEGGVVARRLDSAAYPIWQKALIDFEFTYDCFADSSNDEELRSFFDEINRAAEMTHVDREIAERLEKDPKKPSKRKM